MKLVLAIDTFKGSLSSREVADAFERGFRQGCPACEMVKVSIADGGEGTCQALVETLQGEWVEAEVCDPLMRPIRARYGLIDQGRCAVLEMAAASGLPLVRPEERDALAANTFGTGQLIADALDRGARRLWIGIGGSATTDGGVGMLAALGYRFLDREGRPIDHFGGGMLAEIASIDASHRHPALEECSLVVACDVTNPLYGPEGAAYVFAPQKGADAAMVQQLDAGLRSYGRVLEAFCGYAVAEMAGAGAAGGLGAGLSAVLGGRLVRGVEMVLDAMQFDRLIEGADLVVTGEGRLDRQTVMGKAPSGVLGRALKQQIPTVAIGGAVQWCPELEQSDFVAMLPIVAGPISLEEAMRGEVAAENVRRTALQIARMWNCEKCN